MTANHYPLWLINGSRGRVSHVSPDGVTIETDAGTVEVPVASMQTGMLEYGYALTSHKAQGITVDTALLYASGTLTREASYVGTSRGCAENHLYGTLESLLPDVAAELEHSTDDPVTESERTELPSPNPHTAITASLQY